MLGIVETDVEIMGAFKMWLFRLYDLTCTLDLTRGFVSIKSTAASRNQSSTWNLVRRAIVRSVES